MSHNIPHQILLLILSLTCIPTSMIACGNPTQSSNMENPIGKSNIVHEQRHVTENEAKTEEMILSKLKPKTPIPIVTPIKSPLPEKHTSSGSQNILTIPTAVTLQTPISLNNQKPSGTLKVAVRQGFNSIDPHKEPSQSFSAWGPGIAYQRILKFESYNTTPTSTMQTICDLCESWITRNMTTFDFKIKDGPVWNTNIDSQNLKVTAFDIEHSLNRMKSIESEQIYNLDLIKNIKVYSDKEISIELFTPDADFLKHIAHGNTKIVSKHDTKDIDDLDGVTPMGSGPWKLTKLSIGSMTFMEASATSVTKPSVNRIQFHVISDSETRLSSYLTGLTDIYELENEFENTANSINLPTEIKLKHIHPGQGVEIVFNPLMYPFDTIETRKKSFNSIIPAIHNLTPEDQIMSLGFSVDRYDWLPKPSGWHQHFSSPPLDKSNKSITDNTPITIDVGDYGLIYKRSAELVSTQLDQIGFKSNIRILNRREYSKKALGEQSFHILIGPPVPHFTPNSYLLSVLHSEGNLNITRLKNNKLDALIEKQSMEYDPNKRAEFIRSINDLLFAEAHRLMPITKIGHWTWKNHVSDFLPNFTGNEYSFWEKVSVNK